MLARGRLVRRIGEARPVEIVFEARRVEALELRVEDSDDAPLRFHRIAARLPLPELYFAAPAGRYVLLLGNPEDRAPRYELTGICPTVTARRKASLRPRKPVAEGPAPPPPSPPSPR